MESGQTSSVAVMGSALRPNFEVDDVRFTRWKVKPFWFRKPSPAEGGPTGDESVSVIEDGGLVSLLTDPYEDVHREYKGWLDLKRGSGNSHRAKLAKTLISLTNFGRGHVVIGWTEENGFPVPEQKAEEAIDWNDYSPDAIHGILEKYANPSIPCVTRKVQSPQDGKFYVIIEVPYRFDMLVRAKRTYRAPGSRTDVIQENEIYTRRPGAKSVKATGDEVGALFGRRENFERDTR